MGVGRRINIQRQIIVKAEPSWVYKKLSRGMSGYHRCRPISFQTGLSLRVSDLRVSPLELGLFRGHSRFSPYEPSICCWLVLAVEPMCRFQTFSCINLNKGRMFDRHAATIPTAGSMQVHTLALTWLSGGSQHSSVVSSSEVGVFIQVISPPDFDSSMRATRRTMSKIKVLYVVSSCVGEPKGGEY